jgi:hypothetical protein
MADDARPVGVVAEDFAMKLSPATDPGRHQDVLQALHVPLLAEDGGDAAPVPVGTDTTNALAFEYPAGRLADQLRLALADCQPVILVAEGPATASIVVVLG